MKLRFERLETRQVMAVNVVSAIPDVVLPADVVSQTINLNGRFDDTNVTGTVVEFTTNSSSPNQKFFVELFDQSGPERTQTTPVSAANFLAYADAGRYTNTIIHRSVPGFVIQGGGFTQPVAASNQTGGVPAAIPTNAPIALEAGNSNVRGTIAMARTDAPNSATSQFFINTVDNSSSLDPAPGVDGYAVFGRVLGNGMNAVDAMAAVPNFNLSSTYSNLNFATLPVRNVPSPTPNPLVVQPNQFVSFPSIRKVGELVYTVQSSDPALATASINANGVMSVSMPGAKAGVVSLTVRATSVHDATQFVEDTFSITLTPAVLPTAIVGRAGNEVWIARSTGSAFASSLLAQLPTSTLLHSVQGDFNGDGRGDFAGLAANGQWLVALTPASGSVTPTVWTTWSMTPTWQNVMAGDFDGDGRTDIAGRDAAGGWFVARSTGTAFTTSRFGEWSPSVDWQNVLAADFDGDGRTDIAGRVGASGRWWVSRSTGTAFQNSQFGTWTTATTWADVSVGDFNGDGRADIAGRALNGAWWVAQSTGTSFTNVRFGVWSSVITWRDVRFGDFDGDGRSDIMGRDLATGAWYGARSTGSTFTNSRLGTWSPSVTWSSVVVGDFNGDGRADLAGRTATGEWWVSRSTGTAFTTSRFDKWSAAATWQNVGGVRI
jgi:cyclophilin family peptidyl-prolyl cis-trans isomerase